jgi:DNA-binding beta-propeller fold protein YncE
VLFSGQRGGDTAGSGVDFVERSGQVVRVHPGSGKITVVATGINAPVDLAVAPDGTLYVLSFCERFLDPVADDTDLDEAGHGGFERHSGSLLRIDRSTGEVTRLASGLDLPTHVHRREDGTLLVVDGQGTPGRAIPSEGGTQPLQGRLLELAAPAR